MKTIQSRLSVVRLHLLHIASRPPKLCWNLGTILTAAGAILLMDFAGSQWISMEGSRQGAVKFPNADVSHKAQPPQSHAYVPMHAHIRGDIYMPRIAFGTGYLNNEDAYRATKMALANGYRHIDTASFYQNEEGVGRAIRESRIPRSELFITTKCCQRECGLQPSEVVSSLKRSLRLLQTTYVDALLIHSPIARGRAKYSLCKDPVSRKKYFQRSLQTHRSETWKAMEDSLKRGLVRTIGISNFNQDQIEALLSQARIAPYVHQTTWSAVAHNASLAKYCMAQGITTSGHSVLSALAGPSLPRSCDFKEMARVSNHSISQLLIRWALGTGVSVVVRSSSRERQIENLKAYNVQLPDGFPEAVENCLDKSKLFEVENAKSDQTSNFLAVTSTKKGSSMEGARRVVQQKALQAKELKFFGCDPSDASHNVKRHRYHNTTGIDYVKQQLSDAQRFDIPFRWVVSVCEIIPPDLYSSFEQSLEALDQVILDISPEKHRKQMCETPIHCQHRHVRGPCKIGMDFPELFSKLNTAKITSARVLKHIDTWRRMYALLGSVEFENALLSTLRPLHKPVGRLKVGYQRIYPSFRSSTTRKASHPFITHTDAPNTLATMIVAFPGKKVTGVKHSYGTRFLEFGYDRHLGEAGHPPVGFHRGGSTHAVLFERNSAVAFRTVPSFVGGITNKMFDDITRTVSKGITSATHYPKSTSINNPSWHSAPKLDQGCAFGPRRFIFMRWLGPVSPVAWPTWPNFTLI